MNITQELIDDMKDIMKDYDDDVPESQKRAAETFRVAIDSHFTDFTSTQKASVCIFMDKYLEGLTSFLAIWDIFDLPFELFMENARDAATISIGVYLTDQESVKGEVSADNEIILTDKE